MLGTVGLSSPRSMILDMLEQCCDLQITLVYGARNQSALYYHQEFVQLAPKHANFTYVVALNDESVDSGWTGLPGFVHEASKAYFENDFLRKNAYPCDPPVMIEACITTLKLGRLFKHGIYTENFFSVSDAQQVHSPLFIRM